MKNLLFFLITISIILLTNSCQSLEELKVFDKPILERVEDKLKEYKAILTDSSNAWTLTFVDDDSIPSLKLGVFRFAMEFSPTGEVLMIGDGDSSMLMPKTSFYSLKQEQTVELSFSTYTYIHDLSDPSKGNSRGKGLGRDFAFTILSVSEDTNTIFLRERKYSSGKELYLKRIRRDSFQNVERDFSTYVASFNQLNRFFAGTNASIGIYIEDSKGKRISAVDFSKMRTQAFSNNPTYNQNRKTMGIVFFKDDAGVPFRDEDKVDTSFVAAIEFTKDGFSFLKDYKLNNLTVGGSFTWDSAKNEYTNDRGYVMKYGDRSAIFSPAASTIDFFKTIVSSSNRSCYWYNDQDIKEIIDSTSDIFKNVFYGTSFETLYMSLLPSSGSPFLSLYDIPNENYEETYDIRMDTLDNRSKIRFVRSNSPDIQNAPTSVDRDKVKNLLDIFFDEGGFFVRIDGKLAKYPNSVARFTLARDPSIYFTAYIN